jgi:serine protease AprX
MKPASSTISLVVGLPGDAKTQRQLRELNKKVGANTDEALPLINGYTIEVPEDQLDSYLAALPESATVMLNQPFLPETPPQNSQESGKSSNANQKRKQQLQGDSESAPGPMPTATHPLGWEEVRTQGLDGSGVTLAVIDSGLFPHQDFGGRIKAFKNFSWAGNSGAHDDYGHGTHVAGVAAGDGETIDGVAPKMDLVGARITSPSEAIKAIDWVIAHRDEYSIDILNLSLGSKALLPGRSDPFAQAAQRAIDAGIITVVAAGNEAEGGTVTGTISTPGILQDAITVGAYNSAQTEALDDDKMWGNSSLGPTKPDNLAKPDLIAPGVGVLAASAQGSDLNKSNPAWGLYHLDSGTSMATPMVGGAIALMLQVNAQLTQRAVKEILQKTALPLDGVDVYAQGAGRLNLAASIDEARRWSAT